VNLPFAHSNSVTASNCRGNWLAVTELSCKRE
jgi:hypothetical protein